MPASKTQVDLDRIEQAAKAAAEATGQLGTQARFSIARLATEVERLRQATPDDLRAAGWCLAVHSDHQLGDEAHTSWVFIKGDRCLTGKGRTDTEALEQAREALPAIET